MQHNSYYFLNIVHGFLFFFTVYKILLSTQSTLFCVVGSLLTYQLMEFCNFGKECGFVAVIKY